MGLCRSAPISNEEEWDPRQRSAEIDKHISEVSRNEFREYKLLLLGSGESGKTTIVKQMKIIHQNGFTPNELLMYRLTVIKNLIDSAQAVVLALRRFSLEPEELTNREAADRILEYSVPADANVTLPAELGTMITSLWKDPVIPALLDRRGEFYMMDNADYFFEHAQRIASSTRPGIKSGLAFTLANSTGSLASAQIAPAVEDEVVSWPAVATIM